jgi:type IV pilus assembly protein PilY1
MQARTGPSLSQLARHPWHSPAWLLSALCISHLLSGPGLNAAAQPPATPAAVVFHTLPLGLNDALFQQGLSQRNLAGVAWSDPSLSQAHSLFFQGFFNASDRSGDVQAFDVQSIDGRIQVAAVPTWRAQERLARQDRLAETRHILVGRVGATTWPAASALLWPQIDADLRTQLNRPQAGAAPDGRGPERLAYLRGSRELEGRGLRQRQQLLGDIVHGDVVYVGGASDGPAYTEASHQAFATTQAAREARLVVGANDGMLHAFSARTGDELWAYIPSWLGPQLALLTQPDYVRQPRAFVDSSPVVADAQRLTAQGLQWQTILAAGTGAGGAGVFALDISGAQPLGAEQVLWEFTRADDADLGAVVGRPRILKLRTSPASAPTPRYGWYVVVASGLNNYVPDAQNRASASAQPALFLLSLDKPAGAAWAGHYAKISFPLANASSPSGLIDFNVSLGPAGEVAQISLGDWHGQLWLLDFSQAGRSDWHLNALSAFQNKGQAQPFYTAKDAQGRVQPISAAPLRVTQGMGPWSTWIWGTGQWLDQNAPATPQTLYAVLDDRRQPERRASSRQALQAARMDATGQVQVPAFEWGIPPATGASSLRAGWFLDLPANGEVLVHPVQRMADTLLVDSLTPQGSSRLYQIQLLSGQGQAHTAGPGLSGGLLLPIGGGAYRSDGSRTGWPASAASPQGQRRTAVPVLLYGTAGVQVVPGPARRSGRLSWRPVQAPDRPGGSTP